MKKILYIIDDINYNSGAQKVTLYQMKEIAKTQDVYLLTLTEPKETIDFLDKKHILNSEIWALSTIYAESFRNVIQDKKYSLSKKCSRFLYAMSIRWGIGDVYFEKILGKKLIRILEEFDDIIVVSEASKLRKLVSNLKRPKKIQWIHTDYSTWSDFSEWTRAVTKNDYEIYKYFDTIVVLSDYCKQGLIKKLPSVSEKVVVIPNLIDGDLILKKAYEICAFDINNDYLNFVTVARIDKEKRIDNLLYLAKKMQKNGLHFKWYIIGDGPLKSEMEKLNRTLELNEVVEFVGYLENPYPVMRMCDSLVLVSKYEGTPVTIDEAMVLGMNIIAPAIGGIGEQTQGYNLAHLVSDDKFDIITFKSIQKKNNGEYNYSTENLKKRILIEGIL